MAPTTPASLSNITHWIAGKPWEGPVNRWGDVYNPARGEPSARVAFADAATVDAAVAAATDAARSWGRTSLAARARILFAFRELVERRKRDLAEILTREHGKVLSDAMGEVSRGLEVVEFACGLPHLLKGEFSENVSTDVDSYSIRQPLGVVAGITPFNFPAMVPMWMYPLAIALRQCLHPQAVREGPVRRPVLRRAPGRGRSATGRLQRRPRRQGRGRCDPRASGDSGGELRRVHANRALYLRDRHAARQARAGARRGEEPHDRPARRRSRPRRRCGGQRRLWLDRPALHGDLGPRRGG